MNIIEAIQELKNTEGMITRNKWPVHWYILIDNDGDLLLPDKYEFLNVEDILSNDWEISVVNNEKNYRAIVSTDWLKKILDCIEIRPGTDYATLSEEMAESIKQVIEKAKNSVGSEIK